VKQSPALRFDRVSKRYDRRGPPALDAATFDVPRGTLTGLVGHNGAGKTTAFSIVGGFLKQDEGVVDLLGGGPFHPTRRKGILGLLPQDAELPDRHTARELCTHLARLQGLAGNAAAREADRVLDVVDLTDRRDARIGTMSHGMQRRVAVATALVGSPPLVLLDEPLSGLDPLQSHGLRSALARLRGVQTLVVSSHDLDELERMSDWVVFLKQGRCQRQGTLAEVTGEGQLVTWEIGTGDVPLAELHARIPNHHFAVEDGALVEQAPERADLDASSIAVMEILAAARVGVRGVRRGVGLERRFIDDMNG
jgi:ABC-2 type transport system ATP-binding protein